MEFQKISLLIRFIVWIITLSLCMIELVSSYYLLDNSSEIKFYNEFSKVIYYISVISHPITVFSYVFLTLTNYVNLSDEIFEATTQEETGEKVYYFFRNMSFNLWARIIVVLFISTMGYFKIFPIIAFVFLPNTYDVKNIIYTSLLPFTIIHALMQSLPTLIIRLLSSHLNEDSVIMDKFNYYNFVTLSIFGLIFLMVASKKYI